MIDMLEKLFIAIGIVLAVAACTATPYYTPTPVSSIQAFSVLKEIQPCGSIYCWHKLPFQDLNIDIVTKIISQEAAFNNVTREEYTLYDDYVAYVWNSQKPSGEIDHFFQYIAHGKEPFLLTRIFSPVRISDVISMFGEPSHILISEGGSAPSHGPWIHFVIFYEENGLMFSSDMVRFLEADEIESYGISPEATIISYDLTSPKSVPELLRTQLFSEGQSSPERVNRFVQLWGPFIQKWRGYGDYRYMKEWEGLVPEYR